MILQVLSADYLGGHTLLTPLLKLPAYKELEDENEFIRYGIDGTIFWANGADIAPEYLLEHGDEA